jgi:hypothetical protein
MYKVVVYAPAERADTLLIFLLYPYVHRGNVSQEFARYSELCVQIFVTNMLLRYHSENFIQSSAHNL